MMDFKIPIPFISKIVNYVVDFCTYRKKWNVFISFSTIRVKNDEYYFTLYLKNNTNYAISLGRVITNKGELFVYDGEDNGYIPIEKDCKYGWCTLIPKDYNHLNQYKQLNTDLENEIEIKCKYRGKKPKLTVYFQFIDFPKNIFCCNKSKNSRIIPLEFLEPVYIRQDVKD